MSILGPTRIVFISYEKSWPVGRYNLNAHNLLFIQVINHVSFQIKIFDKPYAPDTFGAENK